jgi:hypothetical protein
MPQQAPRRLDVIQVPNPCTASWDRMRGDDTRRFCEQCRKFVHDLSAMPADAAERLVCESAGELCVRFARDVNTGRVITLDYAPVPKTSRRRAFVVITSILAATCTAATLGAYRLLRKPAPPPPIFIAGAIALPPPAVQSPSSPTSSSSSSCESEPSRLNLSQR